MTTAIKKKRNPRRLAARGAPERSDLGGLALFASTLGNILQASEHANLTREKERLLAILRAWQGALQRAHAQNADLRREVHLLRQANTTLMEQVGQLERERVNMESRYAEVVKELDAARASSAAVEKAR